MKNMLELPKESDYHQTTIVDINQAYMRGELLKKDDLIIYRKGFINLRSIIDVFENTLPVDVVDEEQYEDFLKEATEWKELSEAQQKHPSILKQYAQMPQPQCPTKKHKLKTTNVLYVNGIQRAMTDDFDEFQEVYFNYLQRQKLNIL